MTDTNVISQILFVVLGIMMFILITLLTIFIVLKTRDKQKKKEEKETLIKEDEKKKKNNKNTTNTVDPYSRQSIMDFMEFEKIEDSMIVQKKGKRFLMVVECQGVNYDLMSEIEKISVEEGFQQFLNTLRHPIQIYIQTRTINLENSINSYKEKIKEIEDRYKRMLYNYNNIKESSNYTNEQKQKYVFELTKQKNLLEYGKDLLANTEKMSQNRSVLNKKYYIVIPYFFEETSNEKYEYEEIRNMAFSELYTKSQAIIRTLSSCSVAGKILNSRELVELLYTAYNRDESEIFGINKAINAGYDELYSTSQDVYEKKIKALDNIINERAIDLANETIEKVRSQAQKQAEEKENNLETLVKKMAQIILEENKSYVGGNVAEKAIQEINKTEGGDSNEEKQKKSTRGRKRKTVE